MTTPPHDVGWDVDGLHYAGLAWGSPENPPLLALHGWLDNAASFARLAPLLENFYVVALDLSGHGQSSWRSPDATYQIYDDVPQLLALLDQLGWSQCHLMGHSRGAIIATLFAASFPERVDKLVLLDGLAPEATPQTDFVSQIRLFIQQRKRFQGRRPGVYATVDEAVEVRTANGLQRDAAELIVSRGLRPVEGGYNWSFDPRLRGASAMKLTGIQSETMLRSVTAQTLLLVAEQGLPARTPGIFEELVALMPDAAMQVLPGGHHFHMEGSVVTLADRIQHFLQLE